MSKVQLEAVLKLVDVQINPQVFRRISQSVAGMPASLGRTNAELGKVAVHTHSVNKGLKQTGSALSQNERAARLFLQRMAQFAILLPTFATLNRAIQGGVKFLFEFDGALRDIIRIDIGNLANKMEEVGDAAIQTAIDFGVTATEVLAVTKVFKQAGFDIEASQAKARAAILATQISTLTSAQATEVFIAAQKQFGEQGDDAIAVLDRLAKVEDLAAVNAADVADAFRTGGNALAEFTGSIDDSIGLIAALREQTRKSGREIGTFFKTLQTRSFAAGESRNALEALGVEVENLDGSLRPTLAVLNDLKGAFDGLTQAQQANAAKAIAGVRQFEGLIGTLNSLDRANELAAQSAEAAGTSEEKRVITDQKLERQIGRLIAQGQALAESFGDAGLEDTLANAFRIATRLLDVFSKLVETVGSLGGNLTPLLALGGVQLGRSVFGLSGGGKAGGGGGGAVAAGAPDFIGPLQKSQVAISSWTTDLKRIGGVTANTGKLLGNLALQVGTNTTLSKQRGLQLNLDTQSLRVHTSAIATDAKAVAASTAANLQQGKVLTGTTTGLIAMTVAATLLPKVFDSLEASARELGGSVGQGAGELIGVAGKAATLGAQFAILGPQAAGIAAVFGALIEGGTRFVAALDEFDKAIEETAELNQRKDRVTVGSLQLSGIGSNSSDLQADFLNSIIENVKDVEVGKPLAAAIQASFNQAATSENFKALGLSSEELRDSLFNNISVIKGLVQTQGDYIASVADSEGSLEDFNKLQAGLADGSLQAGQAFGLLVRALGAGQVELNKFTNEVERALSFDDFQAAQDVIDLGESIRDLGREMEIATLGPKALADDLVRLRTEFLITQDASARTQKSLREELNAAIVQLGDVNFTQNLPFKDLLKDLLNTPETFDNAAVENFKEVIRSLPKVQRDAAEDLLKVVEKQVKDRLNLQNKENALVAEESRRRKAILESEAQATQNAFEASRKFTAELVKFGDAVNTDVLSAFQNLSLADVDQVLAGTSELSGALQQVILSAFADPIAKAEQELSSVTAATQAELEILASRLDLVNTKLEDEANAADKASLISEQRAIELQFETVAQEGIIAATDAKIKILEAEKEAAEDAAEAERKRQEALQKLADASRQFDNELRDVRQSFDDFTRERISDLLDQETDARSELKDAQQEVLSSTIDLAEAYTALVQAQLEYNGVIAEARIKSGLLARDIALLTGQISTFDGELSALGNVFADVLNQSNITLQKRIDLERQLAEETLTFLQQAKDEIVQAGLGVFGQTGAENQALGQGIAGLQFVADQLGGSFESFLSLTQGELSDVSQTLLGLPSEFRQQILEALSFLPSSTNIGGFSVDQLTQALGQVGAGVAPEAGLPSIEELNNQQVEQLTRLQELALQDAQLQFGQVLAAQEQLAAAEEAAEAAKLLQERSEQNLAEVRDAVLEEKAILDLANEQRNELLNAVIEADDQNTLMMIEKEAQAFADQNAVFREVGDNIVKGIGSAIGARLAVLQAAADVGNAAKGYIPNLAGGNLSPDEAAGVLRAASREKRAMPANAGLAVANTSEAIIPMRNRGFIPNFQDGNFSSISGGIAAIKQINETVVAAIARSVTTALSDLESGGGETPELLNEVIAQLRSVNDTLENVEASNSQIQTNTTADTGGTTGSTGANDVNITLQTNQNNRITVSGLETLRDQISEAVRAATSEQVDEQLAVVLEELDNIITTLQERGLLSSFGQPR